AVAREEGGVVGGVEDREGEHPVEFLAAVFAPDVIREKQNFGVAVRSPVIVRARLLELAPQLAKVVTLAVVDQLTAAIVAERLIGARIGVDDRESAVRQGDSER